MALIWIFFGGGLGACSRYGLGTLIARWSGSSFPVSTLVINVTGSFLIGLVSTFLLDRSIANPAWRWALITGFLGGYTTFSAYSYETVQLFDSGHGGRAVLYVLGSNALSIAACVLGIAVVRLFVTDAG